MRNAGLDEAQAGIKIAGKNINNLRYANDTTLMAESEELKSLFFFPFIFISWRLITEEPLDESERVKKLA